MSEASNKRSDARFRYRINISYEKMFTDGSFAVSVATTARDVGINSIGFYCSEEMPLDSKVRVTFSLSKDNQISYLGRVRRVEISDDANKKYVIGAEAESLKEEDALKLGRFLNKMDIYSLFDGIDLNGVVDINLVAGMPPVIKKIGSLKVMESEPLDEELLRNMLLNMLDEDRHQKFIKTKELNLVMSYRDKERFRVNLHVQRGKVEGTFRLIPSTVALPAELGLPEVIEKILEQNKKGLIMVAGRLGAGKSTSLSSMVQYLNNTRQGIIITIEDPIEYLHNNNKCIIKQREVGRDTLSFSNAARNSLRQTPDVLFIGEILDSESMDVAIAASESGVLVLTSIHASNSSQALDMVASFFPPVLQKSVLYRLSFILKAIIAQELIPKSDGSGLVVAAEVLIANDAVRQIIRNADWKQIPTAIIGGRSIGMQSMQNSLEQFYNYGLIDGEYLKGDML